MENHAIKRAKERYGLNLTVADLKNILDAIFLGHAKNIIRPNMFDYVDTENAHYRLRYKGVLVEAVVRSSNKKPYIVTFYPTGKKADRSIKNWLKRNQDPNFKHLMKKHGKDSRQ